MSFVHLFSKAMSLILRVYNKHLSSMDLSTKLSASGHLYCLGYNTAHPQKALTLALHSFLATSLSFHLHTLSIDVIYPTECLTEDSLWWCLVESCFIRPDEFIPERWFLKPELIINKAGYAPFSLGMFCFDIGHSLISWISERLVANLPLTYGNSTGRASCIGKQLALLELRTTVALLVTKFNITFPPANDKITIVDEVTDHFANTPGNLKLVFTPHEQAQSWKEAWGRVALGVGSSIHPLIRLL